MVLKLLFEQGTCKYKLIVSNKHGLAQRLTRYLGKFDVCFLYGEVNSNVHVYTAQVHKILKY